MRKPRAELLSSAALVVLRFQPTEPFVSPTAVRGRETCGSAVRALVRGGRETRTTVSLTSAGNDFGSGSRPTPLCRGEKAHRTGRTAAEATAGSVGAESGIQGLRGQQGTIRKTRDCSSSSRLHQQAAPGLPEGDEGIADFSSLGNPAKDKDYGDDNALQYGVSVGAEAAGAGAAHHFFSADTRVVFGVNALEIGLVELYDMGLKRAMIVTGWNQARADPVVWELLPRGFDLKWHSVSAEPSLSDVAEGASLALDHRADCVVAMGGAAVIDAAKAIAAIVYADKDSAKSAARLLAAAGERRERIGPEAAEGPETQDTEAGAGSAPLLGPVPLVAIPIIAGIGSEVTPMATILDDHDPLEPVKVTVGFHNSAAAMPAPFMAIVEPRLTMRVPLETTWPRAFVALAGCLESYVAGRGFVPDLMSHQGIERVSRCLERDLGFRGPLYQEREDIAFAGVVRGLVASRTEWTFLHKLASAVAVASSAPYANCVARLFPRVLEAQIAALRREEEAYMDPAYHRRARARARGRNRRNAAAGGGTPASADGGSGSSSAVADNARSTSTSTSEPQRQGHPEVIFGDDPVFGESSSSSPPPPSQQQHGGDGGGSEGRGREKVYSDDYNDRACALLLKYKRVAGFVVGAGKETAGGRRKGGRAAAAAGDTSGPSPEDIVEWLDARLLDKNVLPLYRTGLRPEHVPFVLEALLRGGGGVSPTEAESSAAFGGLGEATVGGIVAGEASRGGGDSAVEERVEEGEVVEEVSPEAAKAIADMFGEGQGQGQTQTGPWQDK